MGYSISARKDIISSVELLVAEEYKDVKKAKFVDHVIGVSQQLAVSDAEGDHRGGVCDLDGLDRPEDGPPVLHIYNASVWYSILSAFPSQREDYLLPLFVALVGLQ